MARRALNRLSARGVATASKPGRHADGGNLFLVVDATGARRFTFLYRERGTGRRVEIGLGSALNVSLADAREKAIELRRLIGQGIDPKSAVTAAKAQSRPFADVADEYLDHRIAVSGQNAKHVAQWRMTLTAYCEPIRGKPVSKITPDDVLAVLTQRTIANRDLGGPLWTARHETASRLRGRIEAVLDYARLPGENPAKLRGMLKDALKVRAPKRQSAAHHAALPYTEVPAFMRELRTRPATAARALEFAILTAARTGEVLGATWEEIELDAGLWTVPADRMKAKAEHKVPLSGRALAILTDMKGDRRSPKGHVFAGQGRRPLRGNGTTPKGEAPASTPLSQMALLMILRRMKVDATAHGFRSSFRDFAGDRTAFPRDVAEAALAHKVGDAVEQAYRRSSALEKRRELMEAWSVFCSAPPSADVIPIGRRA